jgi:hypothetical protein
MLSALMEETYRKYFASSHTGKQPCGGDLSGCVECHINSYPCCHDGSLYECDNYARVYILRYVAAHVRMAQYPLVHNLELARVIRDRERVSMVSLGGAYGNETFALADLAHREKLGTKLIATSIDKSTVWRPYHDWMIRRYLELSAMRTVDARFLQADVTKKTNTPLADIVYVPWILSEHSVSSSRREILQNALSMVADGGFVIVMDRVETALFQEIDGILSEFKSVEVVDRKDYVWMRTDIAVPDYVKKECGPKLSYRTRYRIIRKAHRGGSDR